MTPLFRLATGEWSDAKYYYGASDSERLIVFFDLAQCVVADDRLEVECFRSTANEGKTAVAESGPTVNYARVLTPCGTVTCNHCRKRVAFDEHSRLLAIRERSEGEWKPLHGGGMTCDDCFSGHFAHADPWHVRYHVFQLFAKDAALVRVPVAKRLRGRETAGVASMPRVPVFVR